MILKVSLIVQEKHQIHRFGSSKEAKWKGCLNASLALILKVSLAERVGLLIYIFDCASEALKYTFSDQYYNEL